MARDRYHEESDLDRGMWEKAGDEVRSWFGDEEAERRRNYDETQQDGGARRYGRRGQGYGPQEFRRGFENRDYVGRGYPNSQGYGYVREPGSTPSASYRGLGPAGYQRSDERIRDDVHETLTWDHAVDARQIQVQVDGGEVTLEGTVPDRFQKRAAEDALDEVRGIRDVHNHLRISSQPGETRAGAGTTGNEEI